MRRETLDIPSIANLQLNVSARVTSVIPHEEKNSLAEPGQPKKR